MTVLTLRTQLLLMDIICLMTGTAFFANLSERSRQVALLTGHDNMQTD